MQHHVHLGAAVQRHAGTMNRVLEGLLADDLACRSAVYCHDIRLNRKKMLVSRNKITKTKYPAVPCCRIYLRSEEHTSELQSLMRISYAVFCLKKKQTNTITNT